MDEQPLLTVLRGGRIFAPGDMGRSDMLLCGDRIAAIEPSLPGPSGIRHAEVDISGMMVVPGFVDLHAHLTGGGGEGGP